MAESMLGLKRSHRCAEVVNASIGDEVTVMGWVQKSRNKGSLIFVDLRDRSGLLQIVFEEDDCGSEAFAKAGKLRAEFCIAVTGVLEKRSGASNENLTTGNLEVRAKAIRILSESETPPFPIEANAKTKEDIRLKYRYLDLRRPDLQKNIMTRSQIATLTRLFLAQEGFLEIETPMLIKSTPEGARDFVVPSRMNPNEFYALPQSPQTFKQLLMVAGMDRYFQIVKCFRDEDLRADRQPEFTQIDCEMSFVDQEDILTVFEGLAVELFSKIRGVTPATPFRRMSWHEAMNSYGSDKPDLRFGMPIREITTLAQGHGMSLMDEAAYVGAIAVEGAAEYTRKQIDALTDYVKRPQVGAKGLIWIKCNADGSFKSSVDKFFDADALKAIAQAAEAKSGDLVLTLLPGGGCGGTL